MKLGRELKEAVVSMKPKRDMGSWCMLAGKRTLASSTMDNGSKGGSPAGKQCRL